MSDLVASKRKQSKAAPYGYKRHKLTTSVVKPRLRDAMHFVRTMQRIRSVSGEKESAEIYAKWPLLRDYELALSRLRVSDTVNASNSTYTGLIRHIGYVMGWPVDADEWSAAARFGRGGDGDDDDDSSDDESSTDKAEARPREQKKRRQIPRSSRELGQRADRELIDIVNHASKQPLVSKLHRYTKWLVMYLHERGWLPLDAQVPLWSEDGATVRTWADFVCYDTNWSASSGGGGNDASDNNNADLSSDGPLILIELKTGYAYGYETPLTYQSAYRGSTLDGSECYEHSAHNQHQLQLGWMHSRLSAALPSSLLPLRGAVLRVNSLHGVYEPRFLDTCVQHYFATRYRRLNATTNSGAVSALATGTELKPAGDESASTSTSSSVSVVSAAQAMMVADAARKLAALPPPNLLGVIRKKRALGATLNSRAALRKRRLEMM